VLQSTVIGLDRIIGVLLDVVPRLRDQLVEHGGVDRGGVGDDLAGCHLQCRERSSEEPSGRVGVAACRDEDVDDLSVLVDRPVYVAPDSVDFDVRLIDVSPIAW
jgi:hypothetical protein